RLERTGPAEPGGPLPRVRLRAPRPGRALPGGSGGGREPAERPCPDPRGSRGGAVMRALRPDMSIRRLARSPRRVLLLSLSLAAAFALGGCASTSSRIPSTRVDDAIRDEFPVEG